MLESTMYSGVAALRCAWFVRKRQQRLSVREIASQAMRVAIALVMFFVGVCPEASSQAFAQIPRSQTSNNASSAAPPDKSLLENLSFKRLTIEQGLPSNLVTAIVQDRRGFMWFGTANGLAMYDGYSTMIVRHNPRDSSSLPAPFITALVEASDGALWAGTHEGVVRIDRPTLRLRRFTPLNSPLKNKWVRSFALRGDTLWIGSDIGVQAINTRTQQVLPIFLPAMTWVRSMFIENDSTVWVGENGLYCHNIRSKTYKTLRTGMDRDGQLSTLAAGTTNAIYPDSALPATLWIGSASAGLIKLDKRTGVMESFMWHGYTKTIQDDISCILALSPRTLLIGTYGNGLFVFDKEHKTFRQISHVASDLSSLGSNYIHTLYRDRAGNLWIGTDLGGVSQYAPSANKFVRYSSDPLNANSLSNPVIRGLTEDRAGVLWIGTQGGGLNRLDRRTKTWTVYKADPNRSSTLADNNVWSVHETRDGKLLVGGTGSKLQILNRTTGAFTTYAMPQINNVNTFANDAVMTSIVEDKQGNIWLGTGQGILLFDDATGRATHYPVRDSVGKKHLAFTQAIFCDSAGLLWISTMYAGIYVFDPTTRKPIAHFLHNPTDSTSVSANFVTCVSESRDGTMYAATKGGGLSVLSKRSRAAALNGNFSQGYTQAHWERVTTEQGLPHNNVYGVLEGESGTLWISSDNGVSCYTPANKSIHTFSTADGLQNSEFNRTSFFKSPSGEIFFGGITGFNSFFPSTITIATSPPEVVITAFKKYNVDVPLDTAISEKKTLTLLYTDAVVSFEFSALAFIEPARHQYAYKLENFDRDWTFVGAKQRFATYTNLAPGTYIFRVKAANSDGKWNDRGASLVITIPPPFWATWWFRALLVVLILTGLWLLYQWRVQVVYRRNQLLEELVEDRTEELQHAYTALEHRNNEMLESIGYAKFIQSCILPERDYIAEHLPEYFILYNPCETVSGDFYFYHYVPPLFPIELGGSDTIFLAVCDCTGHGIPGGFMTMMGNDLLRQLIVDERIVEPNIVLQELHRATRTTLRQTNEFTSNQDGMDVCLCRIERFANQTRVVFAGAKRPLYYVRHGVVQEIKGNRVGIGGWQREAERVFTPHEITLPVGESAMLYFTSDGFSDQPNDKREAFGNKRLRTLLEAIAPISPEQQQQRLEQAFNEYRASQLQRDDVTIVGVKI